MAPRKIYAHVLFYGTTLLVTTGGALAFSKAYGKTEDEKIAELVSLTIFFMLTYVISISVNYKETKYADRLKNRGQKRQELQQFFDKVNL